MKPIRLVNLIMILLMAFALSPGGRAAANTPARPAAPTATYVPGEVVVVLQDGQTASQYAAQASSLAGEVGAAVAEQYGRLALLSFSPDADVEELVARISASGQVKTAQPNYVYGLPEAKGMASQPLVTTGYHLRGANGKLINLSWEQVASLRHVVRRGARAMSIPTFPNELPSGNLWGWDRVQADLIWSEKKAGPTVCVLDTGVDSKHTDLAGKVILGMDFVNNDKKPDDDSGHGTHVAGVITAKLNSGADSAAGVSLSKVLAVKVLNSQGFGTTFTVAAGVNSCAANSTVKIINLSLASPAKDAVLYGALKAAINKNQLVVAAAGNDSLAVEVYPAAWAAADISGPSGPNEISGGLIAVGAARSPATDGTMIWVDRDGDNTTSNAEDKPEIFSPEECATGGITAGGQVYGSNYGHWVSIVAPGEAIYSTTPMSYPFYSQYYEGVTVKNGWMSGTSQAAAFVSGAAARVLSVVTKSNAQLKTLLIQAGDSLADSFASDGTTAPDFQAALGYGNQNVRFFDGEPVSYGVPFEYEGQSYIMAPFCWPEINNNFGTTENMAGDGTPGTAAVYLNVARAMGRDALVAEIKNATNGTPLDGASVTAKQKVSGAWVLRDTAKTVVGNGLAVLTNLPVPDDGSDYQLAVTKAGFTTGAQVFNELFLDGKVEVDTDVFKDYRGEMVFDKYSTVGLGPSTAINIVLDWVDPTLNPAQGMLDPSVDLDLYLWLPASVRNNAGGIIGTQGLRQGVDHPDAKLVVYNPAVINVADPTRDLFLGIGALGPVPGNFSPMALYNFDGGVLLGMDPQGQVINPTESISIAMNGAGAWFSGKYGLFVTDYSKVDGYNGGSGVDTAYLIGDPSDPDFAAPVVRVWIKGVLSKSNIIKLEEGDTACNGSNDWWKAATLQGSSVIVENLCDTGTTIGGFMPYWP